MTRADALRNIERILDAAIDELARDPEASMSAIARRAGVVRATLYVHFPTREALIDAVTKRALAETAETLSSARPDEGDPLEALERCITVAWRALGRFHALVQINVRSDPERLHALHEPVLGLIRPLLERGQASGELNRELSVEWMLRVILDLVHLASLELSAGRLPEQHAERVLLDTLKGALAPAPAKHEAPLG
jgi:TetR/AcrR family transcriptional regulator, mexCD-oprJ operon repressor